MENYTINGVEVAYDTFDIENMEVYDSEIRRVTEVCMGMKNLTDENYLQKTRAALEDIMDAFDCIIGEGTAAKVFGGRMNFKTILSAWQRFTDDVAKEIGTLNRNSSEQVSANREQRRAAERGKRRAEAKARIAKRDAEIRAEMNEG